MERTDAVLKALTVHIAQALGDKWQAKSGEYSEYLEHSSGAKIRLQRITYGSQQGRIMILGDTADLYNYILSKEQKKLKVTVASDRAGDAVAGVIRKKLIPVYLPIWERATKEHQAWKSKEREALEQANRLAGLIGGDVHGHEKTQFYCNETFGSKVSVTGSVGYRKEVDLSLRDLSIAQVEAIVRVLKSSSCPDFGKSA
jgi:hypothetical protein